MRSTATAKLFLFLGLFLPYAAVAEDACTKAHWAIEQASKLSGLSIKSYTACESLDPDAFRALARKVILKDTSVAQLPYEEVALKFLGIIPDDYAYADCLVDSYATSAAAFYSPYIKKFIVPNWSVTPGAILVHEAEHALQDQHFKTQRMATNTFLLNDDNLAAASVLEGDAMEVENHYVDSLVAHEITDPDIAAKLQPVHQGCELPALLNEILTAPYDYGLLFMRNLKAERPDDYRQKIFTEIPKSTRQILHYKEYLAQSRYPHLPRQKALFSKEIGELSMRVVIRNALGMQQGVIAAAGLADDTFSVSKAGSLYHIVWKTLWNRERDADEFRSAMTKALSKRFATSLNPDAKGWTVMTKQYADFSVSEKGQVVTLQATTIR